MRVTQRIHAASSRATYARLGVQRPHQCPYSVAATVLPILAAWALLVLSACAGPRRALPAVTRLPVSRADLIERDEWYGVYREGRRVGWSHRRAYVTGSADDPVYRIDTTTEIEMPAASLPERTVQRLEFDASPPFQLRTSRYAIGLGEDARRDVRAVRRRLGYEAAIYEEGEKRRVQLRRPAYDLVDALTPRLWCARGRAPGEKLRVREFVPDTLGEHIAVYEVVGTGAVQRGGQTLATVECLLRDADAELDTPAGRVTLAADGTLVAAAFPGHFELRVEPAPADRADGNPAATRR